MASISVFARYAMKIAIKDAKKAFEHHDEEPLTDRRKESGPMKKGQLVMMLYWYFRLERPADSAMVDRLLAYFLVKYSLSAGNGLVRLKKDTSGRLKLKPYNPNNYFHRKKYGPQHDAAAMLAFDCERTQEAIRVSLENSIAFEGVMNGNSIRKYISPNDLKMFEFQYINELTFLFS